MVQVANVEDAPHQSLHILPVVPLSEERRHEIKSMIAIHGGDDRPSALTLEVEIEVITAGEGIGDPGRVVRAWIEAR